MASWEQLSPEIQLMILDLVTDEDRVKVAAYACVSKKWQAFFEEYNFSIMRLQQEDVAEFCRVVQGNKANRLDYIRVLKFYVVLDRYNCSACRTEESEATVKRNNTAFTSALWNLLAALSVWKKPDGLDMHRRCNGLRLELGVYSPSDSRHTYRDFRLRYPFRQVNKKDPLYIRHTEKLANYASIRHGWLSGTRTRNPRPEATRRVFGAQMLNLDFDEVPGCETAEARVMPTLDIVKTIQMCRQFYRMIHPHAISRLLASCPNLLGLWNEHWRRVEESNFDEAERAFTSILANGLPKSMIWLRLFQVCNSVVLPNRHTLSRRRPRAEIGQQLAKASVQLHIVAVSFIAEADDFFAKDTAANGRPQSGDKGPATQLTWPHLTCLALTSSTLFPKSSPRQVQELLMSACRAASQMPKLKVLELWYATDHSACVFRFKTQPPTLYMAATWHIAPALPPGLVQEWQSVADKHSSHPINVQIKRLNPEMDGHLLAIRSLRLTPFIMGANSYYEMVEEQSRH